MTNDWWLIGVEGKGTGLGTWDLSVRTTNCLKNGGISTEEDLLLHSEQSLMSIKNFGEQCLLEIKQKVDERGLKLTEFNPQSLNPSEPLSPLDIAWGNNLGKWNLSVRTTTCLKTAEIITEEDLLLHSEQSLMSIKNFGEISLQEIKQKVDERGLKLREIKEFKVSPASFPNLLSQGYEPSQISQMTNTKLSKVEETLELYRLANEGYTLEEIGKKLGEIRGTAFTREWARQLITEYWPELAKVRKEKQRIRKQNIATENKIEKFAKKKIEFTNGTGIDANKVLGHLRESKSTFNTAEFFDIPQEWVHILYDLTPDDFPKCYTGSQYRVSNAEILENLKYAYETLNKGKLTMQMYESFRAKMNPNPDEKQSSWVHHQSVIRKFGGWQKALEEAGIPTFKIGEWLHDSPSFTDDELLDFLRTAFDALRQEKLPFNMYKEYRNTQDDDWPSAPLIQHRFGSWNKALEAAKIPTTPHRKGGNRYTDEELLDFLRIAYTEIDQGQLTIAMYIDFAAQQESEFSGISSFQSRFGSWNKALEAAGIPAAKSGRGSGKNYSDEELLNFLRIAYTEIDQGQLSIAMYENYVDENNLPWPKESYLINRFGKWSTCLEVVGIPAAKSGRGSGKSYSDEELLNFLRTAYTELGQGRLSTSMYKNFAAQQENEFSGIGSFLSRFGSWNKALEAAGIPRTKS